MVSFGGAPRRFSPRQEREYLHNALLSATLGLARHEDPSTLLTAACRALVQASSFVLAAWVKHTEQTADGPVSTFHSVGPVPPEIAETKSVDAIARRFGRPARRDQWMCFFAVPNDHARVLFGVHACRPRYFDQVGLDAFMLFANLAGTIFEQARLRDRLRQDARQLSEADRRKDEFLAMLGHELRNPLAPIVNAAALLKLQRDRPEPERVAWAADIIGRQAAQLTHLVNDLLDVARISQGRVLLKKERVNLTEVVRGAIETAQPLIKERGHRLTAVLPPKPVPVDGDFVRLAQVVANLLDNAAKYTPTGGQVEVSVNQADEMAVVRVRDTGVGIPAAALPEIFAPFWQSARPEPGAHGLGLGLALVRKLVELHGGQVQADSAGVGRGSEFTVRLPVARGAGADPPPHHVLLVDDNRDVADSYAHLLKALGHEVQVAYHGKTALDMAADLQPAIAFIDIGLPDMDGFEVARRLRRVQPHCRLVALTGCSRPFLEGAEQLDVFDEYLIKPAEMSRMQALLEGLEAAQRAES